MTEEKNNPEVVHNQAEHSFQLQVDGSSAVLIYRQEADTITFLSTEVPAELEGRGLGSQLARAGLNYAREKGFKVVTVCWFVAGYVERHLEYQDLLKQPD